MKQKVVIKVSLNDQKSRTKAIKTAVGVDGVMQAALQQEKNQIEVTGDDMDVVLLTTLLRKSLKYAEVVSVSPVEEKKPDPPKPVSPDPPKPVSPPCTGVVPVIYECHPYPYYPIYECHPYPYYPCQEPSCSIM